MANAHPTGRSMSQHSLHLPSECPPTRICQNSDRPGIQSSNSASCTNTSGPSKWRHFNHAKHQQHPLLLSQKLRCDTSPAQLKLGSLAPTLGSCLAGDSTTAITTPETATGWQHMPPRPGQLNTYAAHTLHMHATAAACCSYTPTLQTAAAAAANTAQKPAAHRCCLTPRV